MSAASCLIACLKPDVSEIEQSPLMVGLLQHGWRVILKSAARATTTLVHWHLSIR